MEQEADKLMDEGCGFANFMGGIGGDETKSFIEFVGNEIWLIERD